MGRCRKTVVSGTGKAQGDGSLSRQLCMGRLVGTAWITIKLLSWVLLVLSGALSSRAETRGENQTAKMSRVYQATIGTQCMVCFLRINVASHFQLQAIQPMIYHSFSVTPQIRRGPSILQPSANHHHPPISGSQILFSRNSFIRRRDSLAHDRICWTLSP
jgi:hypothetical protein